MRRLFRALDLERVEYLLISGQASILYGAAQFSEDIDLWVRPTTLNLRRLRRALARARARVYKLTPPIELRYARRGHGFHFTLPGSDTVFLDIMAVPPRVGPFAAAARRARRLASPWGRLPVVAPEDLVLLKQTRRQADYEVISNLVRLSFEADLSRLGWAVRNTFDADDLRRYLKSAPPGWRRPSRAAVRAARSRTRCRRELALEMARLQSRDDAYWRTIVRDLRRLRRRGRLIPEGTVAL